MRPEETEESLALRGLHVLAPWTWRALVLGVVLLAAYVAVGRFLLLQLHEVREPLLAGLSERLPFTLEADEVRGGWTAFSPEIEFTGLRLVAGDGGGAPVALSGGRLRVDVPASLAGRTLQVSRLELTGLELDARLTDAGAIEIRGFRSGGAKVLQAWLETFLPNVRHVTFRASRLKLETPAGPLDLTLDLRLDREGNERHLQGNLRGEAIELALRAEGIGSPLDPLSWAGDVFVDARSSDLEAFDGLWKRLRWPFSLAGQASVQFWLAREEGSSSASVRVSGETLRLEERHGAWSLPLDALAFEAALSQRDRHWSLLTEDFHVERAQQVVDLDRAQFDWWGRALRIRMTDLELDALPALLAAAPGIPAGLREALPDLSPRGQVRTIELRLDDLARPADSWRLRVALDEVAVGSWRGAPSLEGISGFLDLGPVGGRLLLDSQSLRTRYPKVYRQAQAYDDALGELRIAWDPDHLQIDSGLLRLTGDEGQAVGLFALDVPLQPRATGIELDLLVGIEDSDLAFRDRYLPYRLPEPLLAWLERSIVGGAINSAGFVWRGSTRRGQEAHRTVQLFVDVAGAELEYDPAWPSLEGLDGTLWIDNAETLARVPRARSAGADLESLMVRVLAGGGGAQLDLAGRLRGDAAAAGGLLRTSPLAAATDGIFRDWTFSGPLEGVLRLGLPLGPGNRTPTVALDLDLDNVDARIAQVDLEVGALTGPLRYRSDAGFRGSRLAFEALGGSGEIAAQATEDASIDLRFAGDVAADAVTAWLNQPLLAAAEGRASLDGYLRVTPAGEARLALESDLVGVRLDAPRPFGKAAEQPLVLGLGVALDADPRLELSLGERLRVAMDFRGGTLERTTGRLGGARPEPERCDARYCLSGSLSSLDLTAWADFRKRYLAGPAAPSDAADPPEPFTYRIDSLGLGELVIGSSTLGRARVDLWGTETLWQGALESSWVQGSLTRRDGELQLLLERLDLDGLGSGEPVALADFIDSLPPMRVDVLDLFSGERRLGQVGFDLEPRPREGALYAGGVTGRLWEIRLDDPYPGLLRWSTGAAGERTEIEFDPTFADFGAVIAAAGYTPSLESERGDATLRLAWPGPPAAFQAAAATGSLRLRAERGRILETRPGPLALIGFFNFAEIVRGLSLSHVFESGIPFETAEAELYLHAGTVEVADLQIDGAASAFAFSGVSDLAQGEVDGELVVTLPVANNLPWVAALAGGPAVAAGVFVVSKVFEKQVNRMSSAVYGVSGDINAPEVEFRRLFDDTLMQTPQAPAGSGTGDG